MHIAVCTHVCKLLRVWVISYTTILPTYIHTFTLTCILTSLSVIHDHPPNTYIHTCIHAYLHTDEPLSDVVHDQPLQTTCHGSHRKCKTMYKYKAYAHMHRSYAKHAGHVQGHRPGQVVLPLDTAVERAAVAVFVVAIIALLTWCHVHVKQV